MNKKFEDLNYISNKQTKTNVGVLTKLSRLAQDVRLLIGIEFPPRNSIFVQINHYHEKQRTNNRRRNELDRVQNTFCKTLN